MVKFLFSLLFMVFFFIPVYILPVGAKEVKITNPDLVRAISEFKNEDYGGAEASLLKAKESEIDSALTHYYLGLTYKELLIYEKAVSYLREAAWHATPVKNAFFDMAEIYFHLGEPLNALKQIKNAEEAGVRPAYTAYLKGLILMSQKRFNEAIRAFDSAKIEDKGLADAADYQKDIAIRQLIENP